MKHILLFLLSGLLLFASGCKKDSDKKFIDELTGTYIAYDTVNFNPSGGSCPTDRNVTYAVEITKASETSINISNLAYCYDNTVNISGSNLTLVHDGCSGIGIGVDPVVTKTGTTLKFTYNGSQGFCLISGRISVVKQ